MNMEAERYRTYQKDACTDEYSYRREYMNSQID